MVSKSAVRRISGQRNSRNNRISADNSSLRRSSKWPVCNPEYRVRILSRSGPSMCNNWFGLMERLPRLFRRAILWISLKHQRTTIAPRSFGKKRFASKESPATSRCARPGDLKFLVPNESRQLARRRSAFQSPLTLSRGSRCRLLVRSGNNALWITQ